MPRNLYVHFPFCRAKCSYCALYSRTGVNRPDRDAYVEALAGDRRLAESGQACFCHFDTVYFGGGSPALCDLAPIFRSLAPCLSPGCEFTVELHPLDVNETLLETLRAGGVNRISMGVQSFDDATLLSMGRGYTADEAHRAFDLVRRHFDNAGIDLIIGYPGDDSVPDADALRSWSPVHCSVYSLQNERGLTGVPDDDIVLDRISAAAQALGSIGLERYEISNYALPGRECRHNLAVWRGEDYLGLGEGACGREGLRRTRGLRGGEYSVEEVTEDFDRRERALFRLRTREGIDCAGFPEWRPVLERFLAEGSVTRLSPTVYRLTPRGTEICDTLLSELC